MKFLIKFPTRGRPEKFFEVLDKYIEKFSNENEYHILVSCDYDDIKMNNQEAIEKLSSYENLSYYFSKRDSKIGAVNRDVEKAPEYDILLLASDDMIPEKEEYDKRIAEEMTKNYPDLDGVVWFFDGYKEDLNTLCILGKPYYDRFGYIYHPDYDSWYPDNEFMDVANLLKKQTFVDEVIIKHEHPANTREAAFDQLYVENDSLHYKTKDYETYLARKSRNFDLNL